MIRRAGVNQFGEQASLVVSQIRRRLQAGRLAGDVDCGEVTLFLTAPPGSFQYAEATTWLFSSSRSCGGFAIITGAIFRPKMLDVGITTD